MTRGKGSRIHMGKREGRKRKVKKRVAKRRTFVPETCITNTITNTPLDPKTGVPIMRKMRVGERKRLVKGWHTYWRAILQDNRELFYLREVIE